MPGEALCFDMYGTLCDTSTVRTTLGAELDLPSGFTTEVDRLWRRKQLQYSVQTGLMERYEPFWELTQRGLRYSLDYFGIEADEETVARILAAYDHLEPFPDVLPALERLAARDHALAVLSNGNPAMLERLATNTRLDQHLEALISADDVGTFKPAPAVYENAAERLDRPIEACRLVSSNAWDIAGAGAAGMRTAFINRNRDPPERIGTDPDLTVPTMEALAQELDAAEP